MTQDRKANKDLFDRLDEILSGPHSEASSTGIDSEMVELINAELIQKPGIIEDFINKHLKFFVDRHSLPVRNALNLYDE